MGETYRWLGYDPKLTADFELWVKGFNAGILSTGDRADSRNCLWSFRFIFAVASIESLNRLVEKDLAPVAERKAINVEMKYFTRVSAEAALSPMLVTDREAILAFDDPTAHFRWGIQFQGRKTSTLFAQWYDELWATIPDTPGLLAERRQSAGAGLNPQGTRSVGVGASSPVSDCLPQPMAANT